MRKTEQNGTEEDGTKSKLRNPCVAAGGYGLVGAMSTAIGASLLERSVHDQGLTVLVGGAVTGAIAGSLGWCLHRVDRGDLSIGLKIVYGVLETGLDTAAALTAPLMGEQIMGYGTEWGATMVSELVGASVLVGAGFALAACGGLFYCAGKGFFSPKKEVQDSAVEATASPQLNV